MNDYHPQPIDTSNVALPRELHDLVDLLAKNAHDHWALGRIREGWTWGPGRSDEEKRHPDLVPYEQLPEAEKEYDRVSAVETIKAIIALGFSLRRAQPEAAPDRAKPAASDPSLRGR